MDPQDIPVFLKFLKETNESYKISEKRLIRKCESLKSENTKKVAHSHLGLNFKRLLYCHQIGQHKGQLLTNNLEKQFARSWICLNRQYSQNGNGKDYVHDHILGRTATDEELIIMNTVIQWLGTAVGMNFIETVTGVEFVKHVGTSTELKKIA